jgi:hypothetical protein
LDPAVPSAVTPHRKAWIGALQILDPAVGNRPSAEDSLRASLTDFVRETRIFIDVDRLPGEVQSDDLILAFRFDRFQQERNTHPAYFPGAVLTLTLYTWLGGPIYRDLSKLSGSLTVKDSRGRSLTAVDAQIEEHQTVSLWSPQYALPGAAAARTALMQQLLDKAGASLSRRPAGTSPVSSANLHPVE